MGVISNLFGKNNSKDVLDNMVKIVKEIKEKYEGDLGGELYIKGNITASQIDTSIKMFSELLPDVIKIKSDEVVAIFKSFGAGQQKCFSTLLFTVNGLYYDVGGKTGTPNFVRWNIVTDVVRRINESTKIRKEIKFNFYGSEREASIYMPAEYIHSVNHFMIPVLKELSNSVEKTNEDEKMSITEKVKALKWVLEPVLTGGTIPTTGPTVPSSGDEPVQLNIPGTGPQLYKYKGEIISEADLNRIMEQKREEELGKEREKERKKREEKIAAINRRFDNHEEILAVIEKLPDEHQCHVLDFLVSLRKKEREEFNWKEFKNALIAKEDELLKIKK